MIRTIDSFFRRSAEQWARAVDQRALLKKSLKAAFFKLMEISRNPASVSASTNWCETWWRACDCHPPGGRYCSGCPGHESGSKCPSGYTVWKGWYRSTGCWCATSDDCPYYFVCCDCVKDGYTCGCKWAFRK